MRSHCTWVTPIAPPVGPRQCLAVWISGSSEFANTHGHGSPHLLRFGLSCAPFTVRRTEGCYLHTEEEQVLLVWSSGQLAAILGHSHLAVTKAITSASNNLAHVGSAQVTFPVVELAQKLSALLPDALSRTTFLSTGSEACEAAVRLAKSYTGKYEIVGLGSSWYGMTGASLSAQYHSGRKHHGPPVSVISIFWSPRDTDRDSNRIDARELYVTSSKPARITFQARGWDLGLAEGARLRVNFD